MKRLSRKRAKDKMWITMGLKKIHPPEEQTVQTVSTTCKTNRQQQKRIH